MLWKETFAKIGLLNNAVIFQKKKQFKKSIENKIDLICQFNWRRNTRSEIVGRTTIKKKKSGTFLDLIPINVNKM